MRKKLIDNKLQSPEHYKAMSREELIQTFTPLIKNLCHTYGDGRYEDDVRQDCILALMQSQDKYDVTIGAHFSAYVKIQLRYAAQCSRQRHYSSIDTSFFKYADDRKKGRVNHQDTIQLIYPTEDDTFKGVDVATYDAPVQFEDHLDNNLTTSIRLILKAIKSKTTEKEYANIIACMRDSYRNNNRRIHIYRTKIAKCLEGTVFANPKFIKQMFRHGT